jgi:hypothetical protein
LSLVKPIVRFGSGAIERPLAAPLLYGGSWPRAARSLTAAIRPLRTVGLLESRRIRLTNDRGGQRESREQPEMIHH